MVRPPEVVEEFGYTKELVTRNRTMPSAVVDAESTSMHGSDSRRKNGGGCLNFSSAVNSTRISKSDIFFQGQAWRRRSELKSIAHRAKRREPNARSLRTGAVCRQIILERL
jgi:hypothetical protein